MNDFHSLTSCIALKHRRLSVTPEILNVFILLGSFTSPSERIIMTVEIACIFSVSSCNHVRMSGYKASEKCILYLSADDGTELTAELVKWLTVG